MGKEVVWRSDKSANELIDTLRNKENVDSLYDVELDEHYIILIDGHKFAVYRTTEQADNEVVVCGYIEKYGSGSKVRLTNKSVRRSWQWYAIPILITVIKFLGAPKDVLVVIIVLFILVAIFVWYSARIYENALLARLKKVMAIK